MYTISDCQFGLFDWARNFIVLVLFSKLDLDPALLIKIGLFILVLVSVRILVALLYFPKLGDLGGEAAPG